MSAPLTPFALKESIAGGRLVGWKFLRTGARTFGQVRGLRAPISFTGLRDAALVVVRPQRADRVSYPRPICPQRGRCDDFQCSAPCESDSLQPREQPRCLFSGVGADLGQVNPCGLAVVDEDLS